MNIQRKGSWGKGREWSQAEQYIPWKVSSYQRDNRSTQASKVSLQRPNATCCDANQTQ